MNVARLSVALVATVLLSTAAGAAHAQTKGKAMDFTVKSEPTAIVPNAGQTVKYDASKGRFGVTLSLQQPDVRPSTLNDVQAGAYYRITPSLRVGGSVSLGEEDQRLTTPRLTPTAPVEQPKVRLETRFKF
jgi:hypothetical protein